MSVDKKGSIHVCPPPPSPSCLSISCASLQALGFPVSRIEVADACQEMSAGEWEGKTRAEIFQSEAALPRITAAQPDFYCPGGESQRQVRRGECEF